jgi:hypothetical protein
MSRAALCVLFAFAALPLSAHAGDQSAVGEWSGALHHGDAAYRVRFHVQTTPDGRLVGTVSGLPGDGAEPVAAAVESTGDALVIDAAGGRWSGVWDQSRAAWVGAWKQADLSEPLALRWDGDATMPVLRSKPGGVTVTTQLPVLPQGGAGVSGGGALIIPPAGR